MKLKRTKISEILLIMNELEVKSYLTKLGVLLNLIMTATKKLLSNYHKFDLLPIELTEQSTSVELPQ